MNWDTPIELTWFGLATIGPDEPLPIAVETDDPAFTETPFYEDSPEPYEPSCYDGTYSEE